MTRILAHQRDLGNGVGLHYSGFRRFSAFPASPNQLLAPTQPRENRRHHPPIREVGLSCSIQAGTAAIIDGTACCPAGDNRVALGDGRPPTATGLPRSSELCLQAETVSLASSKLYTLGGVDAGDLGLFVVRHPGQDPIPVCTLDAGSRGRLPRISSRVLAHVIYVTAPTIILLGRRLTPERCPGLC
jgi:hypothetical protein